MLYGISSDGCLILLTGDVGTGKTTVCRCLLAQLPENTEVALIVNPRLSGLELLETICDELGISLGDNVKSPKECIDRLNDYLLRAHGDGKNVALLIDEAQNLSLDILEQLRLLTNLETDQKKLLKIVLLGQSELREFLEQPGASQISQRITSRFHLLPLDSDNCMAYIRHRLLVAGTRKKIFSKAALSMVYSRTHGIPRLVNVLCDRSMLGAYVEEEYLVSSKIVEKAAREVLGTRNENNEAVSKKIWWPTLISIMLLACLAAAVAFYYSNGMLQRSGQPEPLVQEQELAQPETESRLEPVF